jgi:DNA-binding transcriptional LysR family regulator
MELSWLEDFLALATHKTFSRAAEMRNVTQPAFSRRIQSLENWMGTKLFVRSPQGTELTPAGKFLRTHAEEATRYLHRMRQEALEIASKEASLLTIAATHALSFVFFPSWIRSHPKFEALGPLNLVSDSMEACEQIMLRGEAEFLLCYSHQDVPSRFGASQFKSIVVGRDVLVPLCAKDANGKPKWSLPGSPSSPSRVLSYGSQSGLGRILNSAWSKKPPASLESVFTGQLAFTLLGMARQGHGIAWLPRTLAAEDVAAGRLIDPAEGAFSVEVDIRLIRPIHRQTSTAEAFWKAVDVMGSTGES